MTESLKTPVLVRIIPQWTVSTAGSLLGTSCRLPHYDYSIEVPKESDQSNLVQAVKKKVRITIDALTYHSIQNRLKQSHEKQSEPIHPKADYENYVSLLGEAARQTRRYLSATGPLEADVTIEVAQGKTGTAGSCDYSSKGWSGFRKQLSPLTVKQTAPVNDQSFKHLGSLRLTESVSEDSTYGAWRKAREDAGVKLRIPEDQSLVTEDTLKGYYVF